MGLFTAGEVVMVPHEYTDLSGSKVRPVLLVADIGRGDWVVSQITSNPYADFQPVILTERDFSSGGLAHTSYLRPGKLATVNESLILRSLGVLRLVSLETCREAIIRIIRG